MGRSFVEDAGNTRAEAWALIWATRPRRRPMEEVVTEALRYVRDKKFQTRIPRGAVLIFDEETRRLSEVVYDGETIPRSAEMDELTRYLTPLPDSDCN